MKDIFRLQWLFNEHVLGNIGLDYSATIRDPQKIPIWIENYRIALSAELAELLREVKEYGIGTHNGKIEIVDMLHFLVSLSHIVDIDPTEAVNLSTPANCPFPENKGEHSQPDDAHIPTPTGNGAALCSTAIEFFLALDDLQNSLKWKWWAKGGGYKADRARDAARSIWRSFGTICSAYGLDLDTIKKFYVAKNELNFKRQAQSYNEDTKDESDNLALKV